METYFGSIEHAHSNLARERVLTDLKVLARDTEALLKVTAGDLSDKTSQARSRVAHDATHMCFACLRNCRGARYK